MPALIRIVALAFFFFVPQGGLFAQEQLKIIFKNGYLAEIPYGYDKIAREMKRMKGDASVHVVELKINGSPFLLNLSDVAAVCKGRCSQLKMVDTRDPSRTPSRR